LKTNVKLLSTDMFTVIAIYKNEKGILNEWINHYLNEGAESIILIDNESDDGWQYTINPRFVGDSRIVFKSIYGRGKQNEAYCKYIKESKSEWTLFVDLDEFMYSRLQYKTISDYLRTVPDDVSLIRVPWKLYGSLDPNGDEIVKQPESVINTFLCYKSEEEIGEFKRTHGMETKTFVRTSRCVQPNIHTSTVSCGKAIRPSGREISGGPWCTAHPNEFERDALAINHYITQSTDYFFKHKAKR